MKFSVGLRPDAHRLTQFFSRVVPERGATCWLFVGARNGKGYGVFCGQMAHRVTYSWFVDAIPAGHEIDHQCENKACVNPAHLNAVTRSEHRELHCMTRRQLCANGHPWTDKNVYVQRRHGRALRFCRACHRIRQQQYLSRQPKRLRVDRKRFDRDVVRAALAAGVRPSVLARQYGVTQSAINHGLRARAS